MDGAFALDCSDLKGKKLLNLDSEEEGVFTVSCAGGVRLDCTLELKQERAADMTGYRVTISGLKGGHSGMNINQGRGNANCLMARTLYSAMERCPSLRVHELTGGEFDNVICLRADALAAVSAADAPAFEAFIKEFDATLKMSTPLPTAAFPSCAKRLTFRPHSPQRTRRDCCMCSLPCRRACRR